MTGDLLKKQMASHSVLQGEDRLYECLVTTLTESVHVHIIYIKNVAAMIMYNGLL